MTVYFIQEDASHQKQVIKNRYLMFLAGNITWVRQTSLLLYEHVIMQGVVFRTPRWASLPGGVLPYMGYIVGMYGAKGYGFSAVLVIKRVSIIAILPPLW